MACTKADLFWWYTPIFVWVHSFREMFLVWQLATVASCKSDDAEKNWSRVGNVKLELAAACLILMTLPCFVDFFLIMKHAELIGYFAMKLMLSLTGFHYRLYSWWLGLECHGLRMLETLHAHQSSGLLACSLIWMCTVGARNLSLIAPVHTWCARCTSNPILFQKTVQIFKIRRIGDAQFNPLVCTSVMNKLPMCPNT